MEHFECSITRQRVVCLTLTKTSLDQFKNKSNRHMILLQTPILALFLRWRSLTRKSRGAINAAKTSRSFTDFRSCIFHVSGPLRFSPF
ncbi:hypothetical protein TGAM01_v204323 [Trichoderma gamsii]|uniref:Uncharacterized protein n=1 Tax=Trichoderma gamsii TaxID=398673 RepID=A0A2P4ZRB2_9HYPO|nr:hypothetical protein TGAM01_v204323 [Trichoderma gamsii]PON26822.1 hypothetical protein TGAM01_v204323 [Trichoderma gamsii]